MRLSEQSSKLVRVSKKQAETLKKIRRSYQNQKKHLQMDEKFAIKEYSSGGPGPLMEKRLFFGQLRNRKGVVTDKAATLINVQPLLSPQHSPSN
jgi:hypothetical protein